MAQAVRVLAALPLEVEVEEQPFGGAAIDAAGDPLPAETLAACLAADAVLLGAVGGPEVGRRQRAARGGPDRAAQGARRLREPASGGAGGVDLLIVRELVGGLYFGARGVRDDGTVFDTMRVPPVADRARRAARVRARAHAARRAVLGRQGERARHLAPVAPRRHRGRRRLPRRRAAPRARRQRRDGARDERRPLRRDRHGEHVRRHPLGRRGRRDRRARRSPRPRASATAARGSSSRCTARRPTSPARGSANPTAMLRSLALLLEHGLGAARSRAHRRGGGRRARLAGGRRPTSAAPRPPASSPTPCSPPSRRRKHGQQPS